MLQLNFNQIFPGLFKKSRSASCTDEEGKPLEDQAKCDPDKLPVVSKGCSDADEGDGSGEEPGAGSGAGSGDAATEGSGEGSGVESGEETKKTIKLSDFVSL